MQGDDGSFKGDGPNIKAVCRSATIALRKADLAKVNGDAEEQLGQLRSFARTITHVLRQHPQYPRRVDDADISVVDGKFAQVQRRIEELGGGKVTGLAPHDVGTAAAEVAASRLRAGGGSLLAQRSRRNALSLANSRASSAAPSLATSRVVSRDSSPEPPAGRVANHTPQYVVNDLSRRLAAMETAERNRTARDVEVDGRLVSLAKRCLDAETATRHADTRAETAERLVWELQEAMEALESLSTTTADAAADRVHRLEVHVLRTLAKPPPAPQNDFGAAQSLLTKRLADLEALVLPTRVAELEQRFGELALSVVPPVKPEDVTKSADTQIKAPSPIPPVPPVPPVSDEAFSDLRERVSLLENVDAGAPEWAHAVEQKSSAALARVDALAATVAAAVASATPKVDDTDTRAAVASLSARVTRAEASAAAAMELAATTSPGTARVKSLVPRLANRVTDVEISTESASQRTDQMIADVQARVTEWQANTPTRATTPEPKTAPPPVTKPPSPQNVEPTTQPSTTPQVDPTYITETIESLREARAMDAERVDELETSVKSAVRAMETLRDVVAAVETRHRESAATQAQAVGEIITATTTAAAAMPMMHIRLTELERAVGDCEGSLAGCEGSLAGFEGSLAGFEASLAGVNTAASTTETRITTLESDTETSSALFTKLAEKMKATKHAVGDVQKELATVQTRVAEKVNAAAVKGALAAVSSKVNALAIETAETVDCLRREKSRDENDNTSSVDKRIVSKALQIATQALDKSEAAVKTAKKAKALAETAAAGPVAAAFFKTAPAVAICDLQETVEALREARGMDQVLLEEIGARLSQLEEANAGVGTSRRDADDVPGAPNEPTPVASVSVPAGVSVPAVPVSGSPTALERLVAVSPNPPPSSEPKSRGARSLFDLAASPQKSTENRTDPRLAKLEADVVSIHERLGEMVVSTNQQRRAAPNLRDPNADMKGGDGNSNNSNARSIFAADAAAGLGETLAEAVERLNARVSWIENSGRGAADTGRASGAVEGAGAAVSKQGTPMKDDRGNTQDEQVSTSQDDSGVIVGASAGDGDVSTKNKKGVFATERAAAPAKGFADLSDADLVLRAKQGAARARYEVRAEAARLGITLVGIAGGDEAGDEDENEMFDPATELTARASAACVADRELATELATVCALVEQEEARREGLRVALAGEGDGVGVGVVFGEGEGTGTTESVALAARREWATCMEAQLRRLRAAAREAEQRNSAAAEERAGRDTRTTAYKAHTEARAARAEASFAQRLVRLSTRVERGFGGENEGLGSNQIGHEKENDTKTFVNAPWGAGPGLTTGIAGAGGSLLGKRHGDDCGENSSKIDRALSTLERKVEALLKAGNKTTSEFSGFGGARSDGFGATPESRALELKSLRQMMRHVQTDVGSLRAAVHDVEMKVGAHTTGVERALRDARLSDHRVGATDSASADATAARETAVAATRAAAVATQTCASLNEQVVLTQKDIMNVKQQVDTLKRHVDLNVAQSTAAAERARGQARTANASAAMNEAKTISLAGELGRVARHVGLGGVGDALRTGVLFDPPPEKQTEDAEDSFEITAFAKDA